MEVSNNRESATWPLYSEPYSLASIFEPPMAPDVRNPICYSSKLGRHEALKPSFGEEMAGYLENSSNPINLDLHTAIQT